MKQRKQESLVEELLKLRRLSQKIPNVNFHVDEFSDLLMRCEADVQKEKPASRGSINNVCIIVSLLTPVTNDNNFSFALSRDFKSEHDTDADTIFLTSSQRGRSRINFESTRLNANSSSKQNKF